MSNDIFEEVHTASRILGFDLSTVELAEISQKENMGEAELQAIAKVFQYMKDKKTDAIVSMLLRTSRLPLKAPKTFENFDFNNLHGKNIETIKNLIFLVCQKEYGLYWPSWRREDASGYGLWTGLL